MARTAVTPVALAANAHNLEGAGTALDAPNGHQIDCSGIKSGKLLIRIKNTFAGSKVATIKAGGVNPPAFRKDLGDLTVTLASQNDVSTLVLETARFVGQSGANTMLYIDLAASMTGTIWVYQLPDTV
jgi:hypothetical protein